MESQHSLVKRRDLIKQRKAAFLRTFWDNVLRRRLFQREVLNPEQPRFKTHVDEHLPSQTAPARRRDLNKWSRNNNQGVAVSGLLKWEPHSSLINSMKNILVSFKNYPQHRIGHVTYLVAWRETGKLKRERGGGEGKKKKGRKEQEKQKARSK